MRGVACGARVTPSHLVLAVCCAARQGAWGVAGILAAARTAAPIEYLVIVDWVLSRWLSFHNFWGSRVLGTRHWRVPALHLRGVAYAAHCLCPGVLEVPCPLMMDAYPLAYALRILCGRLPALPPASVHYESILLSTNGRTTSCVEIVRAIPARFVLASKTRCDSRFGQLMLKLQLPPALPPPATPAARRHSKWDGT
eukprot:scaffold201334_cov31-Tisochrysis_lutea.AAC.2